LGLLHQLNGITHPHGWIETAQVLVEGGVAGGSVYAAVVEGAIEQQQSARPQHPRGSG